MSSIGNQLTLILQSVLTVLRAFALWSPPHAHVVSLGRDTWIMPGARRMEDNPHLPLIPAELRALLRDRAARAITRLLALFASWQAGTLPKPQFDFPRPRTQATPRPRRPYQRLPRSRAWAGARVLELRAYASQLSHLLANPEMAPFLAACPQAGRLLRPLCHAIGADLPPRLVLPAQPRRQRPPRLQRPRPLKLTDPSLGLQPYVIRAVRYMRRKYGRDA
jgi:hypothetical protein